LVVSDGFDVFDFLGDFGSQFAEMCGVVTVLGLFAFLAVLGLVGLV